MLRILAKHLAQTYCPNASEPDVMVRDECWLHVLEESASPEMISLLNFKQAEVE